MSVGWRSPLAGSSPSGWADTHRARPSSSQGRRRTPRTSFNAAQDAGIDEQHVQADARRKEQRSARGCASDTPNSAAAPMSTRSAVAAPALCRSAHTTSSSSSERRSGRGGMRGDRRASRSSTHAGRPRRQSPRQCRRRAVSSGRRPWHRRWHTRRRRAARRACRHGTPASPNGWSTTDASHRSSVYAG